MTATPSESSGSAAAFNPGAVLGQYRIVRLLGRGGMGEVYEVEHAVLHRRYALKLLPAEFAAASGALERFQREARVMAALEHPNILQVDDFGETGGRYWLRMELANGVNAAGKPCVSLADWVEAKGGKLDAARAAGVLGHILSGLAHAHKRGVVHRDLKPANILLLTAADGKTEVKIADFGLVRLVGEEWVRGRAEQSIRLSMSLGDQRTMAPDGGSSTGSLIGTYAYMSPEQKRGAEADMRSDVYAMGLIAYRLFTGRKLGLKKPSELVPGLAPAWDTWIMTALEEAPGDRFADAGELLAAMPDAGDEGSGFGVQGSGTNPQPATHNPRFRVQGSGFRKKNPQPTTHNPQPIPAG